MKRRYPFELQPRELVAEAIRYSAVAIWNTGMKYL
jgi:hypothetical protein